MPVSPSPKRLILIVDDDQLLLDFLGEVLGNAGYDILKASSAEQALGVIAQREPDLALLDIHMPGMTGLELAKQLRVEYWDRARRQPAMSSFTDPVVRSLSDYDDLYDVDFPGGVALGSEVSA